MADLAGSAFITEANAPVSEINSPFYDCDRPAWNAEIAQVGRHPYA